MDNEEYVILKSYDGKNVRVPYNKKEEYTRNQEEIKHLLSKGKTIQEIIKIMSDDNDK